MLNLLVSTLFGSLGPGEGPWRTEPAESHGLNATLLADAVATVGRLVPERYCVLIVKDGVIVHETTIANSTNTTYESDSLAKTATSLVIGAAVQAGLIDLDTPLAAYGVPPTCDSGPPDCWRAHCPPGVPCPHGPLGFFRNQTARTLLSQASGCVTGQGCFAPPGSAFTYDSEQYIQHLAHLLGVRAAHKGGEERTALAWASRLMATLGLRDFYADDGLGNEFSAGGGQYINCRGAARLAQLVLNRGLWPSTTGGAPIQLVGEAYIEQMLSPQFESRGYSYGLLAWLNAKRSEHPLSPPCCAPRWGPPSTCSGETLRSSLLGDDIADVAPPDVAIAMGWLGQCTRS
jgi:CubicO group peptidase (beta-lactamase class C family)